MPSLEEEATMSEPFYSGEWDGDPDWYPGDNDTGWPYPDNDNRIREGIYGPGDNDPADHPPTYDEDPSFYGDDDYPSEPEDWRHGEPAGDEERS